MPPGTFAFNKAKTEFFRAEAGLPVLGPDRLLPWNAPEAFARGYKLLFVCNGGVANGLDALGAEDATQMSGLALVMANRFDGAGVSFNGLLLVNRTYERDDSNDLGRARAADVVIQNLFEGSVGHRLITDIVLMYNPSAVSTAVGNCIPLMRYALSSSFGGGAAGQGVRVEIQFNAGGCFVTTS
jgi:hypothetical protein